MQFLLSLPAIQKSLSYYIDVPGFSLDFEYGEPVVYAGVKSGGAEIYFTYDPHMAKIMKEQKFNREIFIWTPDAIRLLRNMLIRAPKFLNLYPIARGEPANM